MSFWESFLQVLPATVSAALARLQIERIYEIRLRGNCPVVVNYGGKHLYLTADGVSLDDGAAIFVAASTPNEVLARATQFSLYAVNSQICEGYLTIGGGIRLGISGETVLDGDTIKTIKNISSLNIRIPHEVVGCAGTVFRAIKGEPIKSTLLISPPGAGKTTMLRDIARLLSTLRPLKNTLIIDERNEIAAAHLGKLQLSVGKNTDVISGCKKQLAFSRAIRSMSPHVIITDELAGMEDIEAVDYAISCGVSIIASTHAADQYELANKAGFAELIKKRLFLRYIILSNKCGPGTCDGIFDQNLEQLYLT